MKRRVLDFIVCPRCKTDFKLEVFSEEGGRIKEGLLSCPSCEGIYPVTGFIPRIIEGAINAYPDFLKRYGRHLTRNMVSAGHLSEAEKLNQKTRKSFGYQWTRVKFSQVIPKFEGDFLNYIYPVQRDFFRGKIGVDIGCGFGRHIYYAAKLGAEMVGIDFSQAIDSSYANTRELSNVHLIQADIYNLPLKTDYFDFVYSIGVLHHLPEPEKGFNAILPLIKPDGHVSIWMYSKSRPIVNFAIESARLITKRIPHNILYFICIILSFLEWVCLIMPYRLLHKIPVIGAFFDKIMFKRIKIYSSYPFSVLSADWFDRLSAPIRYYYSQDELRDWFKRAGLNLINISPTGMYGWRVFGQKAGGA